MKERIDAKAELLAMLEELEAETEQSYRKTMEAFRTLRIMIGKTVALDHSGGREL